jgi:glucose-6-phosphate isomerase
MKTFVLLAIGFSTLGCQAIYTSIQPAGDKTYFLTQVHSKVTEQLAVVRVARLYQP